MKSKLDDLLTTEKQESDITHSGENSVTVGIDISVPVSSGASDKSEEPSDEELEKLGYDIGAMEDYGFREWLEGEVDRTLSEGIPLEDVEQWQKSMLELFKKRSLARKSALHDAKKMLTKKMSMFTF